MKQAIRLSTAFFVLLLAACNSQAKKTEETEIISSEPVNKGKELVEESVKRIGDYKKIRSKKDVVYTYTYSQLRMAGEIFRQRSTFLMGSFLTVTTMRMNAVFLRSGGNLNRAMTGRIIS